MTGRIKRKALAGIALPPPPLQTCALCDRPLGARVEWHHIVPKSEGGRDTVPIHPICHRTIHATYTNTDLARRYATIDLLRAEPAIQRYLDWIADKPADFNAPTRRARSKG